CPLTLRLPGCVGPVEARRVRPALVGPAGAGPVPTRPLNRRLTAQARVPTNDVVPRRGGPWPTRRPCLAGASPQPAEVGLHPVLRRGFVSGGAVALHRGLFVWRGG